MPEMKDSGIEWIGDIPCDWEINRLQYCLNEINIKNNPVKTNTVLSLVKDKGVMPYEGKGNQGNKAKEDVSEYHLAYPNTIVLNCMNVLIGSVGISNYFGCVSPVYYVFKDTEKAELRFINYIFNTRPFQKELRKFANGILEIRLRVSSYDIFKQKIALPLKDEQVRISNFLEKKCSEIDLLSADIQSQIDVLEEYKKSVITEAVTKGLNLDAEMNDSNIEWIGEFPKHWNLIKIKNVCWLKGRIGWQGLRSDEFIEDGPYLITGTDFNDGYVNWNTCVHISEERYLQDFSIHIKEGDLLITKDGTIGKVVIVKNCPEKVSLNSGVMIIRNNKKYNYFDKYIYYLLLSNQFTKWFNLTDTGNSTIKHLTQDKFYKFKFTYPPIDEQIAIANYLDSKSTQIDSAITDKKAQLKILTDYKKSLIYEYVTGKKEVSLDVN